MLIRQQHLQSRAGSVPAGKRSLLFRGAINPECPVSEAPALPCHHGAQHTGSCSCMQNHWKCSPWFPVVTNPREIPQLVQQGNVPSMDSLLFLAVGLRCTWMEELLRQAKTQRWFGVLEQGKHSSAYTGVRIDSASGCGGSGFGHQMAAGEKE